MDFFNSDSMVSPEYWQKHTKVSDNCKYCYLHYIVINCEYKSKAEVTLLELWVT